MRGVYSSVVEYASNLQRRFHKNPELSGREVSTARFVEHELSSMNIAVQRVGENGILGALKGSGASKSIMLRAEMDALPCVESPSNLLGAKKVCSLTEDAAHLCGHDFHQAILLAVAKVLSSDSVVFPGNIYFCFESGEETGEGVDAMVSALESLGWPTAGWGIHLCSHLDCGKLALQSGGIMAGSSKFDITIRGKGGHGGRPDQTADPITCAAQIICGINVISSRIVNPIKPLVLTIGSVHAGSARNLIPEECSFSGTIRFFDPEQEEKAKNALTSMVEDISRAFSCRGEMNYLGPYPAVVNDSCLVSLADNALQKIFPKEDLVKIEPWMASDTMVRYMTHFPCLYALLGCANQKLGYGAPHHNPKFDADPRCLESGIEATLGFIRAFFDDPEI